MGLSVISGGNLSTSIRLYIIDSRKFYGLAMRSARRFRIVGAAIVAMPSIRHKFYCIVRVRYAACNESGTYNKT